jgi:hypothetical protein
MKIDPPQTVDRTRPFEKIDSDEYHSLFDYEED